MEEEDRTKPSTRNEQREVVPPAPQYSAPLDGPLLSSGPCAAAEAFKLATPWRKAQVSPSQCSRTELPTNISRRTSQRKDHCHCDRGCRNASRENQNRPVSARSYEDGESHRRRRRHHDHSRHKSEEYRPSSLGCAPSPVGDKLCQSHPSATQFKVVLDVRQFNPEDLTVKTCGKHAVIQAVRTEDRGRKGIVVKEFTRRYLLPEGADTDRVSCSLTEDGFLTVDVPMRNPPLTENERLVPITVVHNQADYKQGSSYMRASRLSARSDEDIS